MEATCASTWRASSAPQARGQDLGSTSRATSARGLSRPQAHLSFSRASLNGAQLSLTPSLRQQHAPAPSRRPGSRLTVHADADYYATLGVGKTADKKEIKHAYRKLAREFHPDVNKDPGAEAKFKEVSKAYEVLSDEEKRSLYDRFGEAGLKGGAEGMPGMDFNNPFDLFQSLFGGSAAGRAAGARNRPTQGEDERYDLTINFLEAVFGAEKNIEVTRLEACGTCSGSGAKPGTSSSTCTTCQGQGQVVSVTQTPMGSFQQVSTCPQCQGEGQISTPCSTCHGDGRVRTTKSVTLKVPAGVDNGSKLRVRNEGNVGKKGGPAGDLYVYVSVRPDQDLARNGVDVLMTLKVSYLEAILGTTKRIRTVNGDVDLKIPAGTQPGSTLVLAKRGVPVVGKPDTRGDQLVKVQVEIPRSVSSEEKELVERLADINGVKQPALT